MTSTWATVEVEKCDEVICPGELPVGLSTLLWHGPHSLLAAHWWPSVKPPHTCSPSSPMWPPAKGPVCCEMSCHCCSREAPIKFRLYFTTRFQASPHAHAGPKAAAVEDEGVGLPGKLDKAHHTVILPNPRHAALGKLSAHHVQLNMPIFPHVILLRTQAVGVLNWHPSAQLLTVYCPPLFLKVFTYGLM